MIDIDSFREFALSLHGSTEHPHFEITSFRVNKKIFATLDEKRNRACLMLSEIDQSVFCSADNLSIYAVPNKWGQKGATYFELAKVKKNILIDALKRSYYKITSK